MTDRETLRAVREARALLRRHGHRCDVSAADLILWLHTETPYPNPSFEEIIRNPFFVVHELIEIGEVRRKGLRITKHVIPRHPVPINWAHLAPRRSSSRSRPRKERGTISARDTATSRRGARILC